MVHCVATIPLAGKSLTLERRSHSERAGRRGLPAFFLGSEKSLARVAMEPFLSPAAPEPFNPVLLVGPAGTGKTHLAHGLACWWHEQRSPGTAVYTSAGQFATEFAEAVGSDEVPRFRARHQQAQLWVLEDIQRLANKPAAQREVQLTFDALERRGASVLATSRVPLAEISGMAPSLTSRLCAGLVVPLVPPGVEARREILLELAQLLKLPLSEEAADLLARRLALTVPGLLKALCQLEAAERTIDAPLARQYLSTRAKKRASAVTTILGATARHFALKVDDLKGTSRNRTVVAARSVAMYLARLLTDNSLEKIGRSFGKRDHTTVLHNCRKIEKLLQTDSATRNAVDKVLAACRSVSGNTPL